MREPQFYQTKIDPNGKSGRSFFLVTSLLGLIMLAVGISSVLRVAREVKALPQTRGTIVALDTKGSRPHKITVEYEAGGKQYAATLENYYLTYKLGRQLPLAYDPEDPARVQLIGFGRYLREGILGLAGFFILLGSGFFLVRFQLLPWLRKRKETGR